MINGSLVRFALAGLSLSACSTDLADARRPNTGVINTAWEDVPQRLPETQRKWTATKLARAIGTPQDCEDHARALHDADRERAWALLSACVRERVFTDLGALLAAPWIDEVKTQPEGATLLARVIAARGGDVEFDLGQVQRRRLPLFSLDAAVAEPQTYAGRLVLVRARADDARHHGDRRALRLRQTRVVARVQNTPSGSVRTWEQDSPRGTRSERASRFSVELRNVSVDTGVEVIARSDSADPFLEPGADYVFLLRFDGAARQMSSDDDDDQDPAHGHDDARDDEHRGIASVIAWFAPQTARFEYAARR